VREGVHDSRQQRRRGGGVPASTGGTGVMNETGGAGGIMTGGTAGSGGIRASGGSAGEPLVPDASAAGGVVIGHHDAGPPLVDAGPPIPTEGLIPWLRADRGVTVKNGAVAAWADQSPSKTDATQDLTNLQPGLLDDAIGGQPAVVFDGQDEGPDQSVEIRGNGPMGISTAFPLPAQIVRNQVYVGKTLYANCGVFPGELAELLVYSRVVTPSEDTAIESYLQSKYACCTGP